MLKLVMTAAATIAIIAVSAAPAGAAPCRDAKGKFVKCPPKPAAKCRDAKGHFAKCGSPGARPA